MADAGSVVFFFKQKTAYEIPKRDWSADVCSSDLCCYEVGEEVRTKFESQFEYGSKLFREVKESDPVREKYPLLFLTARAPGHSVLPKKIFLDLVEANRQQLLAAGLPKKNIESSPLCTNCQPHRGLPTRPCP